MSDQKHGIKGMWLFRVFSHTAQIQLANAQREDIERNRKRAEIANKIMEGFEFLVIYARWKKQHENNPSYKFSETEIRANLKHYEDFFSAIMNIFIEKDRAKEIRPGWWSIDE
jgi:hypothetical protein